MGTEGLARDRGLCVEGLWTLEFIGWGYADDDPVRVLVEGDAMGGGSCNMGEEMEG